mgnify:CR=1 FL=1
MAKIPQNIIDEIRERIDIIDVIGKYIPLKRAGENFRSNCPFHKEKSPSFMVSPRKQIYHCFGCHKGGNVYSFLMEFKYNLIRVLGARVKEIPIIFLQRRGGKTKFSIHIFSEGLKVPWRLFFKRLKVKFSAKLC